MRQRFQKYQKAMLKKKQGNNSLSRILDLKEKEIPAPPVELEWMKLEQRIEMAEAKARVSKTSLSGWLLKPGLAMAAIVLIAISSLLVYRMQLGETYQTSRQEWQTVVLPDSSEVQLHCESRLTVRKGFDHKVRFVALEGEAYFKVQKSNYPFQIKTDQGVVTVVGTEFNVRSRKDEMEVAVNEGVVLVESNIGEDKPVALTQGKMTRVAKGEFPEIPSDVQFDQYPGWLHGTLTVNRMKLIDLIKEIERRFDITVVVRNADVHPVQITGLFDASEVMPVLESLCVLIQKEIKVEGDLLIIE